MTKKNLNTKHPSNEPFDYQSTVYKVQSKYPKNCRIGRTIKECGSPPLTKAKKPE